jgi:predicted NAD/FAD-dependent oxidoreductase
MARAAIIGAGLAGLVVARGLQANHDVTVFEKSRGVGGRMATRYAGDFEFDHGAQFFTARSETFRDYLAPLISAGVVADWPVQFAEFRGNELLSTRSWNESYAHYVGVPRMNAVGKYLANNLHVVPDTSVGKMSRRDGFWHLYDVGGTRLGRFDWVVLTAPAPQSAELAGASTTIRLHATSVQMQGCFALMLGMADLPDLSWQAALVRDADISWISLNSSKPGRPAKTSFVVHSTNAWADRHIEAPAADVRSHMLTQFSMVTGLEESSVDPVDLHRWRYANLARQHGQAFVVDPDQNLAACGDWFVRGRVEGAFSSAVALLHALADQL